MALALDPDGGSSISGGAKSIAQLAAAIAAAGGAAAPAPAPGSSPPVGLPPSIANFGFPGAPPPPSSVGQGYYQDLLASDPQLAAALAAINAQTSAYQGQMTAAQQQLLEQFGEIPPGLASQYASLVNPTVQGIAAAGTAGGVSTVAQLQKALANARTGSLDSLASRGLLHSGALGQHENENLQSYNVSHYNALQSLLGQLGTNYSTFLGQQDTANQQSQQATSDALTRIINQIQAGNITAPTANVGTPTPPAQVAAAPAKATATPFTKISALSPYAVPVAANPTGASANKTQGIFAIH